MLLYLNILTVVLLALVAGFLLMLSFQLKTWRRANAQAPLLAEKLAEALLSARKGLADLKAELVGQGPELGRLTSEASKLRVELQFLIQRGSQMAERLDAGESKVEIPQARVVKVPITAATAAYSGQKVVEQVAMANGQAAKPVGAEGDPLEELLAGLQAEPEPKKGNKRKRIGPVTQAELDLQQSLLGDVRSAG